MLSLHDVAVNIRDMALLSHSVRIDIGEDSDMNKVERMIQNILTPVYQGHALWKSR